MFESDFNLVDIFKQTKHIALIGASNKEDRASYRVMRFLLNSGYQVYPVNPVLVDEKILGQPVYADIKSIPVQVDMVDVFRQSIYLYDIIEQAVSSRVKIVWTQLGVTDEKAEMLAKHNQIQMVVDKCPAIELPRLKALGFIP
ncbi:hypothetical protein A9Q98_10250 [Thalassotalea sp. 42_200_T64]|nr:hypothetical protein A9Q98_10250 [Thalassotalea sp. 42_200_T64]